MAETRRGAGSQHIPQSNHRVFCTTHASGVCGCKDMHHDTSLDEGGCEPCTKCVGAMVVSIRFSSTADRTVEGEGHPHSQTASGAPRARRCRKRVPVVVVGVAPPLRLSPSCAWLTRAFCTGGHDGVPTVLRRPPRPSTHIIVAPACKAAHHAVLPPSLSASKRPPPSGLVGVVARARCGGGGLGPRLQHGGGAAGISVAQRR